MESVDQLIFIADAFVVKAFVPESHRSDHEGMLPRSRVAENGTALDRGSRNGVAAQCSMVYRNGEHVLAGAG